MNLTSWVIPPWVKMVAVAVVIGLLISAGWTVNGWRNRAADADKAETDLKTYRDQVSDRDSQHEKDLQAATARAESLSQDLASMRAAYSDLLLKIPNLKLVENRNAPPDANGRCSVPVRTADFRMCHNAAWSGDTAALIACGTQRRDAAAGSAMPAADLVRQRKP